MNKKRAAALSHDPVVAPRSLFWRGTGSWRSPRPVSLVLTIHPNACTVRDQSRQRAVAPDGSAVVDRTGSQTRSVNLIETLGSLAAGLR